MASKPVTPYVASTSLVPFPDMELQLKVDPSLAFESPVQEPIVRPPGIQTMRQWGEQVFPEGKHQGSKCLTVYNKDLKYVTYMKSHSNLTSPWAKSFQNFCKMMAQPTSSTSVPGLSPKTLKDVQLLSPSVSEWDVMGSPPSTPPPPVPMKGKRGSMEVEIEKNHTKMDVVKDAEKEQDLLTKIAILQRELDNLKQET